MAIGYSCTAGDTPTASDPDLACATSTVTETGVMGYCCIPFSQSASTCQLDDTVKGCDPGAYAFSCAGSTTPDALDSGLSCKKVKPGDFCCTPAAD